MRITHINGIACLLLISAWVTHAQVVRVQADTVSITLHQAEERFQKYNLQLLAARYNIEAAQAAKTQAELWSNPNIAIEQNIYNQYTKKWFDYTSSGNTEVQLQQLIVLSGKRGKRVALADINAQIAEHTLGDLLRQLRFTMRTDLFDLYFLQQSLAFYDETIPRVKKTVLATQAIYEKRAILLADVLRLKSLLLSLENERLGLLNKITETESELAILLRDTSATVSYFMPALNLKEWESLRIDTLSLSLALDASVEKRPDYKIAEAQVRYEETNLDLQKSMRIPDLTVGGRYSRAGSYIPDYYALTLGIDLPIFDRNQGNIEVSENTLEANKLQLKQVRMTAQKEIETAYRKAVDTDRLFRMFRDKFTGEYKTLLDGMDANFEKRNITLVEFTDFYESYRTSILQINQLQNDRLDAFESLNYVAGTTLISP